MSYTLVKTFSFPSSYGTAFKARLFDSTGTQSGSNITGLTANSNGILLVNITVPSEVFVGSYRVWRNSLDFTNDPYDDAIGINPYMAPPTGAGPYLFELTVEDQDSNPLENALVRVVSQSEHYEVLSPVSGLVNFGLSAETYTITVTKSGYEGNSASLAISGNSSLTIGLTEIETTVIPEPDEVVGTLIAYDENNDAVAGVVFQFQLLKTSCEPDEGQSYPRDIFEATSQAYTGLVEVALLEGATYQCRRVYNASNEEYGPWKQFVVDTNPFTIPQILGYLET